MKKTLPLLFLILIITGLHAQQFSFAPQASLVVSNYRILDEGKKIDEIEFVKPMLSYSLNFQVAYKSASFWGLSAEPGFIRKGAINEIPEINGDITKAYQYLYFIQIPMLADFYPIKKLCLSVGLESAYLFDTKTNLEEEIINDIWHIDDKLELSALIGVSYGITSKLDLGFRYGHALSFLQEITYVDENGNALGSYKWYNQYFQLLLRYKL